jgi:putative glutamine amidotransferase
MYRGSAGKDPSISAKIGITTDVGGTWVRVKRDYVFAVAEAGGVPLLLTSPGRRAAKRHGDAYPAEDLGDIMQTIDGVLIPGGEDLPPEYYGEEPAVPPACLVEVERERCDFETVIVREALRRGKPVLGICYGMQFLNVLLGGSLYQDLAIQGVARVDHRKKAHRITLSPAFATMLGLGSRFFTVNSSHHQAVKRLGRGLGVSALSEDGVIEGIRHEAHPFVVGVQWHPERGVDTPLSRSLFTTFIEAAAADRTNAARHLPGAARAV